MSFGELCIFEDVELEIWRKGSSTNRTPLLVWNAGIGATLGTPHEQSN